MHSTADTRQTGGGTGTARVLALALGTFAAGADSFVLAGILPAVAGDLHVSVAQAGYLVSVFTLAYAVLAPLMASLTGGISSRPKLSVALAVFTVANVLSALSPTFGMLLATRVLAAAGMALYTPSATTVATRLVAPERQGRALGVVLGD